RNNVAPKIMKKRGRKSPLIEPILVFMLTLIENDSQITLQSLRKKVEETFSIETSVPAIHNALSKLNVSWKTVLPIPVSWNTPDILRKRTEFVGNTLVRIASRVHVYLDEKGWNLTTRR